MKMLPKKHVILPFLTMACFVYSLFSSSGNAAQDPLNSSWDGSESYTVLESEGGTYFGPVVKLAYSGDGEFRYLEDGYYEGSFSKSKREGSGTFTWDNGDTFVGTWKDDNMCEGVYTFADGRTFTGTFVDNQFLDGEYNIPKNYLPKGWEHLSGTCVGGQIDEVNLIGQDGVYYVGNITGRAQIHYPSGNVYDGDVVDGKRSGYGLFNWMSGDTVVSFYEGEWKNNIINGMGTYHYEAEEYPNLYGSFDGGRPVGQLVYNKAEGNAFKTTWENGLCINVGTL